MEILKPIKPGEQILSKPVAVPAIRRNLDGSFEGRLYIGIGGIPQGHVEVYASGLEAFKALINGLMGFVQMQSDIVIANGSVPTK